MNKRKKIELLEKTVRNLKGTIQFENNSKFNNLAQAINYVKSDFQRMLLDQTIAFTNDRIHTGSCDALRRKDGEWKIMAGKTVLYAVI